LRTELLQLEAAETTCQVTFRHLCFLLVSSSV